MYSQTVELEISENEILEIDYQWQDYSFDHAFGTEHLGKIAELKAFRVIQFEGPEGDRVDVTDRQSPATLARLEQTACHYLEGLEYEPRD